MTLFESFPDARLRYHRLREQKPFQSREVADGRRSLWVLLGPVQMAVGQNQWDPILR